MAEWQVLYDAVRMPLDGGATLVQIREKDLDPDSSGKKSLKSGISVPPAAYIC